MSQYCVKNTQFKSSFIVIHVVVVHWSLFCSAGDVGSSQPWWKLQFPRGFDAGCSQEKCALIITVVRMSDFVGLHACVICWVCDLCHLLGFALLQMLCKNDSNKAEEVKPQKGSSEDETEVEMEDAVQKVCSATGCSDVDLVSHILEVEDYNVESAIFVILQMKEVEGIGAEEQQEPPGREQKSCSRTLWEENGTGSRIFGNQSLHAGEAENNKGQAGSREENRASRNPKVAKRQRKEQQRLEKKKRQEERHRQKVLATKGDRADTSTETEPASHVTLVKAMAALNI